MAIKMKAEQNLPSWIVSGSRAANVLTAVLLLSFMVALLCLRAKSGMALYILVGATSLAVVAFIVLVALLAIRRPRISIRNVLLGAITYFVVASLWKWRALAHHNPKTVWINLLWLLFDGAIFMTVWEAMRVAFRAYGEEG
jgi:hypothetical protein